MPDQLMISTLSRLFMAIPQLVIVIAAFYYISKFKTTDAILILIGSLLQIILIITNIVVIPVFLNYSVARLDFVFTVISGLSFLGGLCFAIGLFILIYKIIKITNEGKQISDLHETPF